MNNKTYSAGNITLRIWMSTALCLSIGMGVCEGIFNDYFFDDALFIIPFFVGTLVGSLPVLPPLWYSVEHIEKTVASTHKKLVYLCFSCLFITSLYGGLSILLARLFSPDEPVTDSLRFGWCVTGILFLASFLSILINYKSITGLFSSNELLLNELIQSNTTTIFINYLNPYFMNHSEKWIAHFTANLKEQRINWNVKPIITKNEKQQLIPSLQAWQLGETSDGSNLLCAATKYARSINDPAYVNAIALFIKEEQKHGENLGCYLDAIGEKRIQKNWGDSLFRYIRHLNTSMEMWTLAVITVESAAQVYYQALKDATQCSLLKEICTDILIDEAYHISFQTERMKMMYDRKTSWKKTLLNYFYLFFYFFTALMVWMAHKKVFIAGGNTFRSYLRKMKYKYVRTLKRLTTEDKKLSLAAEDMMLFNIAQTFSKRHKMN